MNTCNVQQQHLASRRDDVHVCSGLSCWMLDTKSSSHTTHSCKSGKLRVCNHFAFATPRVYSTGAIAKNDPRNTSFHPSSVLSPCSINVLNSLTSFIHM